MLIKYIYDYSNRGPDGKNRRNIGCLVMDNGMVGVSICNPKDDFFKSRARDIAIARMNTRPFNINDVPKRYITDYNGRVVLLQNHVQDMITHLMTLSKMSFN
jgi:hypothetical protein